MFEKLNFKLFLFCFVVVIAIFLVYLSSTAPKPLSDAYKTKALTEILGRAPKTEGIKKEGHQVYKGKYFSLQYPGSATLYTRKNKNIEDNPSILEHFRFNEINPRIMFVAQVLRYSSSGIDEVPAIVSRRHGGSYKELSLEIDGYSAVSFEREGNTVEKSAFLLKDGMLYTFVASGSNLEYIVKTFDDIVSSITL